MADIYKGSSNVVETFPIAPVVAGTVEFVSGKCLVYVRDAAAGQQAEPVIANTVIRVDKAEVSAGVYTAYATGVDINIDAATQLVPVAGGTRAGICASPSPADDKYVQVRINE